MRIELVQIDPAKNSAIWIFLSKEILLRHYLSKDLSVLLYMEIRLCLGIAGRWMYEAGQVSAIATQQATGCILGLAAGHPTDPMDGGRIWWEARNSPVCSFRAI